MRLSKGGRCPCPKCRMSLNRLLGPAALGPLVGPNAPAPAEGQTAGLRGQPDPEDELRINPYCAPDFDGCYRLCLAKLELTRGDAALISRPTWVNALLCSCICAATEWWDMFITKGGNNERPDWWARKVREVLMEKYDGQWGDPAVPMRGVAGSGNSKVDISWTPGPDPGSQTSRLGVTTPSRDQAGAPQTIEIHFGRDRPRSQVPTSDLFWDNFEACSKAIQTILHETMHSAILNDPRAAADDDKDPNTPNLRNDAARQEGMIQPAVENWMRQMNLPSYPPG